MIALFSMISNAFVAFILFFNKYVSFANSFSALTNLRFLSRKALFIIVVALLLSFYTVLLAFFYFSVDSLLTAYNLVSALIHNIQIGISGGYADNSIIAPFYLFLNVSGIATGISTAFPFISAALTFRFMKYLYVSFSNLLEKSTNLALNFSSAVTAS